jgi:hypothetical protein
MIKMMKLLLLLREKTMKLKVLFILCLGQTLVGHLDRMQRERGVDPGINELMIATTVEEAKE